MLNELVEYKNTEYNVLFFTPVFDKTGYSGYKISSYNLDDVGKPIIESKMGYPTYHIFLLKFNIDKDQVNFHFDEEFDGVLLEPLEYMSRLIQDKIFGVIIKKSENSKKIFVEAVKTIKENLKD